MFGDIIRPIIIVACVVTLGVEASMHNKVSGFLYAFDLLFVFYFIAEMLFRAIKLNEWKSDSKEIKFWFWFDALVTFTCSISLCSPFVEHPALIGIFRILRILRLFRLFSIFPGIRSIEKKILVTLETVVIFGFFSILIVYVYAVVGINVFSFKQIGNMNFANLYDAMVSMFVLITNDWADSWRTVRNQPNSTPVLLVDLFFFTFIISAVIFTLNAFIAVMTSQIEQNFTSKMNTKLSSFEDNIDQLRQEEKIDTKLIEQLLKEVVELKRMLEDNKKR